MPQRNDYRHTFAPQERLPLEILVSGRPPVVRGRIVNLSVTGALVEVGARTGSLRDSSWVMVRFEIPGRQFELHGRVVYADAANGMFGLCFVKLVDPKQHELQERDLWSFLLEQQRQQIRMMKDG